MSSLNDKPEHLLLGEGIVEYFGKNLSMSVRLVKKGGAKGSRWVRLWRAALLDKALNMTYRLTNVVQVGGKILENKRKTGV